MNKVRKEVK